MICRSSDVLTFHVTIRGIYQYIKFAIFFVCGALAMALSSPAISAINNVVIKSSTFFTFAHTICHAHTFASRLTQLWNFRSSASRKQPRQGCKNGFSETASQRMIRVPEKNIDTDSVLSLLDNRRNRGPWAEDGTKKEEDDKREKEREKQYTM